MPTRYRCNACGNLTRFDVVTTTRTRAFHHFSVGGELSVEDAEVLESIVEEVSCRWCGSGSAVVEITDEIDDQPGDRPGDRPGDGGSGPPPEVRASGETAS